MTTILHILQHALGLDEFGRRKHGATEDFRSHFCTSPGGSDWDLCSQAVAAGLMKRYEPTAISGGDWIFCVTAKGEAYVTEHSPPPPKVSRSRSRYLHYLSSVYAEGGMSFGEWLKGRA